MNSQAVKALTEMEEILLPILQEHGAVGLKDDDSLDVLDGVHFMELNYCTQKTVLVSYIDQIMRRYSLFFPVSKQYEGCTLPLHVMALEAQSGVRTWKEFEVMLSKLPPCMGKIGLMWGDSHNKKIPLHHALPCAPRSTIELMLKIAPESARLRVPYVGMPLHVATYYGNIDAVESLVKHYPQGLLVVDICNHDPIYFVSSMRKSSLMVNAIIRGLVGAFFDNTDTISDTYEMIISIISEVLMKKYDVEVENHDFTKINDGGCDNNIESNEVSIRQDIFDFLQYCGDRNGSNISDVLLILYCFIDKDEMFLLELESSQHYLDNIFGDHVSALTSAFDVELKLCRIIERHKYLWSSTNIYFYDNS